MITTQTTTILKWLANLSCALEDHQAFCESDEPALAEVSRGHAATAVDGIRTALSQIERSLDLVVTPLASRDQEEAA